MIIQHNISALNNINIGNKLAADKGKIMEKLASGYQINRAADNAANLAISEKMNSRIRALRRIQNNIEEGIGLCQTADGALAEVNDMLNRVHELCVQAANGTNTAEDRDMIADEIDQLYEEMDRIFEDTEYNTIPVFRHDGENFYEMPDEYGYKETITQLPNGELAEWGEMIEITGEQEFDLAEPAQGASVTLTLDDEVDLNDASTLDGKKFRLDFEYVENGVVKKSALKFEFLSSLPGGGAGSANAGGDLQYKVSQNETVEETFNGLISLCRNMSITPFKYIDMKLDGVAETNGEKKITISFEPMELNQKFEVDGTQLEYPIADGNGAIGNEFYVSSYQDGLLEEVDTSNNTISYSKDIELRTVFYNNNYLLTDERKEAIIESNLEFYLNGNITEISFSADEINALNTLDELNEKVKEKFEAIGCEVEIDGSNLVIRMKDCVSETQDNSEAYLKEVKKSGSEKISNLVNVVVAKEESAGMEKAEKWTVELPPDFSSSDMPISLNIGGNVYTFYNQEKVHIRSKNSAEKCIAVYNNHILAAIKNAINESYGNATADVNGDKIVVKGNNYNEEINLEINSVASEYYSLGFYNNRYYETVDFTQEYYIKMNLSESITDAFIKENLYGKGFTLNEDIYEFSNATNELSGTGVYRVDISSCSNYDEIAEALEYTLKRYGIFMKDVINENGIITIVGKKEMRDINHVYNKPSFMDGNEGLDGLFNNEKGTIVSYASGGTNTTQPSTTIDFSSYLDNPESYYGTGFRVTCATCPGEFFNVIFCHDKATFEYPESFEYTDDSYNPPVTNTIYNYFVELKDVTSAEQIVGQIVSQLGPDMDHYTEVEGNGSTLIIKDKRAGNLTDSNGTITRAKVISGVYTNFTYDIDKKLTEVSDKLVGEGRKDTDAYWRYVMIYSSDTADKPYIPVHLPYLSVENLKLAEPDGNFDSQEGIEEILKRSKDVAEVISMARSKIGADQNRLEHAYNYAANAQEQMTDSYSRLRDTDMAEAVTINAKISILENVQQAMLAQIANMPEQILTLLQE